jgi:transposase
MTLPTTEQLERLSHAELIALIKELISVIEQQQARIAELEAELDRRSPGATSRNSSTPPSRDRKSNQPENKERKKHGPPEGHPKHWRPLVDQPDVVIPAPVSECRNCRADLSQVAPEEIKRRQVTELPPAKPVVIETQQSTVTCPHCQTVNQGVLPEGLEAERCFGPQLEATVIYYKHEQHLSYERIVEVMRELHGVVLSEGAIAAILERGGKNAAPVAAEIKEQVISSPVIKSDETSARVEGRNWWEWVFIGGLAVYHTIVPSRSAAEITNVMGEHCAEVWVSDCLSAQLKAPAQIFQLCLGHQIRDLERVLDHCPEEEWAHRAQELFREAIHLKNRFVEVGSEMTLDGYLRRVSELENRLDRLLDEEVKSEAAGKLQARFGKHRDKLLTFLHYPAVPPTNNECEQALRKSVVHRKVTNGFRSKWGAKAYAALQTIISTARRNGEGVFQTLVNLMGKPVLPFLEGPSP